MGPWPTANDYSLAVARRAFVHPGLAGLTHKRMRRLNRPALYTGHFSATFALEDAQGRPKALKLFTRDVPDRAERYAAISEFLTRLGSPFFVGFEYLDAAVQTESGRHPGLLMEWADGCTLDRFIADNLDAPDAIRKIGLDVLALADLTEAHGFAHGDLQHENMLVSDRLRLIDYDGLYVPALAGRSAAEHGHQNYQHPGRRNQRFCASIDRFSAIVIYLSLYAAVVAPHVYQSGVVENGLLFRKVDFDDPKRSAVFTALSRTRALGRAARALSALCERSVDDVPSLSVFVGRTGIDLRPRRWRLVDAGRALADRCRDTIERSCRGAERGGAGVRLMRSGAAEVLAGPWAGLVRWGGAWRPVLWSAAIIAVYVGIERFGAGQGPPTTYRPGPVFADRPVPPAAAASEVEQRWIGPADCGKLALWMSHGRAACCRQRDWFGPRLEDDQEQACRCADASVIAATRTPQSRLWDRGPATRAERQCEAADAPMSTGPNAPSRQEPGRGRTIDPTRRDPMP